MHSIFQPDEKRNGVRKRKVRKQYIHLENVVSKHRAPNSNKEMEHINQLFWSLLGLTFVTTQSKVNLRSNMRRENRQEITLQPSDTATLFDLQIRN